MALYGNQKSSNGDRDLDQIWRGGSKAWGIGPAKIDEMLIEALEALEQTRRLHESTANPETKRQAKRILDSLSSSLHKLAPLGIHSVKRLERMPVAR